MKKIETLEEGLNVFTEGFVKALIMLKGAEPNEVFNTGDYKKYYSCVYDLCRPDSPPEWRWGLYRRYAQALRSSIKLVVLPSLENKRDDLFLLPQLLHMWSKYRAMARFMSRFLVHFPAHIDQKGFLPLTEVPDYCFCSLVCSQFFDKCCDAVIFLINQEREGELRVDQSMLKFFMAFSVEMGGEYTKNYYYKFEQAVLNDAVKYYSQFAPELLEYCDSSAEYIKEVVSLQSLERARARVYINAATLEKLIEVVTCQLMYGTAINFIEKDAPEGCDIAELDLLFDVLDASFVFKDDKSKMPIEGGNALQKGLSIFQELFVRAVNMLVGTRPRQLFCYEDYVKYYMYP